MPIDAPALLPPCTEMVLSLKRQFSKWESLGSMQNGKTQAFIFKTRDGDYNVYIHFVLTPDKNLAEGVVRESSPGAACCKYYPHWKFVPDLTCQDNGTQVYTVLRHLRLKEDI